MTGLGLFYFFWGGEGSRVLMANEWMFNVILVLKTRSLIGCKQRYFSDMHDDMKGNTNKLMFSYKFCKLILHKIYMGARCSSVVTAFAQGAMGHWIDTSCDPLSYFSFQPMLLIRKSSPCGGSRSPLSLFECSFTICLMPYNHK